MKKGMVLVCIVEGLMGMFIGSSAVYAIIYHDVYYGGTCVMATLMAVIMILALMYVNDNIVKEDED